MQLKGFPIFWFMAKFNPLFRATSIATSAIVIAVAILKFGDISVRSFLVHVYMM